MEPIIKTTEYEIKSGTKFSLGFAELWQYKELFYFYTWRDIKVKYKQTVLGFAWAILQPLLMMLLFTFVFGTKLQVPSDGLPYPVFVFSGLLLWNIFANGLANAGNSMVTNANIIKKIYFPRLIVPLSSVLVALFDFLMALVLYIPVLMWYGTAGSWLQIVMALIGAVLIVTVTTLGLGAWLAALNVKYRDFRYVIPFLIQVLLFITPVIYPASIIDNPMLRKIFNLNPLSGAISLFRSAISGAPVDTESLLMAIAGSIVLLLLGIFYFRKTEAYFADIS